MKVLHLTPFYPTSEHPTSGSFVKSQIDSLTSRGIESDVMLISMLDVRKPSVWLSVRRRLRREPFDLLHCHYGYALIPTLAVWGFPFVVSFCGTDVLGGGGTLTERVKHRALVLISNVLSLRAKASIAKSEGLRASLWFSFVRSRCEVIPNGVNLEVFHPVERLAARQALGLSPDKLYLLFAGRADKHVKRLDLIREALSRVRAWNDSAELLVVQGEPQARLNLYYSAADCLVLASEHEGSPNVVKEAMACNLPIVSVDVGDVREVVAGTPGCLMVARRPEALAAAIRDVTSPPLRTSGRSRIERLDAAAVAARVEDFYCRAIGG